MSSPLNLRHMNSEGKFVRQVGLYSKVPVKSNMVVLPLAIEAASRANGDRKLSIYQFASHVNHCWSVLTFSHQNN